MFISPDQLAGLTYLRRFPDPQTELHSDMHRWLLWGRQDGYDSRWYASFTSRTPRNLIAATTARLADTTPVLRYAPEVPSRNRDAARIAPVTPPVPTPLDVLRAAVCWPFGHHVVVILVLDQASVDTPSRGRVSA
ncbi:DUF317 domain-containing protein [Streptomyces canus]|uniref:DUF317 domain-containing protein n=1 Tax=Streptomyces canus TaxID=58343 RepID=UPI0036EF2FB4